MIGVDIIDLSCSFAKSKYSLEDYQRRMLNQSEYGFCYTKSDLDLIWAIKESAYKCYFKQTNIQFLNPKRILVTSINTDTNEFHVQMGEEYFAGYFSIGETYIYAICNIQSQQGGFQKVFMGEIGSPQIHQHELYYFFNESAMNAHYCNHSSGFPEAILLGNMKYAYSRSHHGSYYIAVISNPCNN